MKFMQTVEAVAGVGLRGDRYAEKAGTYSQWPGNHEVTLVALEAMWDFEQAFGLTVHPAQMRRNLVTADVDLPGLIGCEFQIGGVRFRGLRPCPPCLYLAQLLKIPEILRGFAHCGGIYAEVLSNGRFSAGDPVRGFQLRAE